MATYQVIATVTQKYTFTIKADTPFAAIEQISGLMEEKQPSEMHTQHEVFERAK